MDSKIKDKDKSKSKFSNQTKTKHTNLIFQNDTISKKANNSKNDSNVENENLECKSISDQEKLHY